MSPRLALLTSLLGVSLAAALAGAPSALDREQQPAHPAPVAAATLDVVENSVAEDGVAEDGVAGDGIVGVVHRAEDKSPKGRTRKRARVRISFGAGVKPSYLQIGQRIDVTVTVSPKSAPRPMVLQTRAPVRGWEDVRRARLRSSAASFRLDTSAAGTRRYRILLPRHGQQSKASKLFRTSVFGTPPPVPPPPPPPPMPGPRGDPSQYAFLLKHRGVPARWNACVPITWGYNPAGTTASAVADLHEGVARLAAQTGYTFTFTGESGHVAFPPDGSARTEPNLLISFGSELTRPDQFDPGSNIAGYGGPQSTYASNHPGDPAEITSGDVLLRTNSYGSSLPGYEVGSRFGRLVLHELGHAVNLGHVTEGVQVMVSGGYPWTVEDHRGYNLGDISGLKALGADAGCFTKPRR